MNQTNKNVHVQAQCQCTEIQMEI